MGAPGHVGRCHPKVDGPDLRRGCSAGAPSRSGWVVHKIIALRSQRRFRGLIVFFGRRHSLSSISYVPTVGANVVGVKTKHE